MHKPLSSFAAAQSVYDVALREGIVKYRSILSILSGAAGSGKSTLKRLLFGMIIPVLRQSTPLAEAPIRAISYVRVDATDVEWHVIDDEGQDRLIAGEMAAGVTPDDTPPSEPTPEPGSDESQITGSSPSTDTPVVSITIPSEDAAPEGLTTSESSPPSDLPTSQPNQSSQLPSSLARPTHMVEDKLVSPIATRSFQQGMGRKAVDMIYLLDCGGQPQFQSILPLLFGEPTTMMFVTNLSERLDHHPQIAFYEQGKPLAQPYPSLLSHEEILKRSVQALQSRVHAEGESQSTTPSLLVVGSHRDRERRCSETRADKNKRLISILNPALQKHLVFYGEEMKELIFPVNAKEPGEEDQQVASELRKAILQAASSLEPEEIPLGWYVLDIALHRLASFLGRGILTRQECLQVAYKLHITEEGFEAALDHLSKLNVILYFRSVLPNLVFCSPQVLLDKISELVQYNYRLRGSPDGQRGTSSKWLKFRDQGIITIDLLETFPAQYVYESSQFTPIDLLQLLGHRLIVAQINETEFFAPFMLPQLSPENVEKYRSSPSSPAAPLVIRFRDGVSPSGAFCAFVASLLSPDNPHHWELLPDPSSSPTSPECVFRNCIKFKLPDGAPGSLTLIDSFTHFEMHIDAPVRVCSKLCPVIEEVVFKTLKAAFDKLKCTLFCEPAVLCESNITHGHVHTTTPFQRLLNVFGLQRKQVHPATVSTTTSTWACTIAPDRVYGDLEERHLIWFNPTRTSGELLPPLSVIVANSAVPLVP